jgi:prepilin-type N-terminal cleavage/methylation domain-containing protein
MRDRSGPPIRIAPRRRLGFTLTETIAALVILSIGLPPMLWSVRDAHAHRANSVLASRARWLATEKLEDIVADRHSTTRGYTYLVPGNYAADPPITGFPGYSRSVTLNETLADLVTAGSGYMNVTVTVSFTDAWGASQSLAVTTVLTDYDA